MIERLRVALGRLWWRFAPRWWLEMQLGRAVIKRNIENQARNADLQIRNTDLKRAIAQTKEKPT